MSEILSKFNLSQLLFAFIILAIFIVEIVALFLKKDIPSKTPVQQAFSFVIEHIFGITNHEISLDETKLVQNNLEEYLAFLIKDSKFLANTVFKRAISYFVFALLVSSLGIVLFFIRNHDTKELSDSIYKFIFTLFDRFGMPIFVETVAFYLFRQFRITMDDFKYYNRISIVRESYLILIKLFKNDLTNESLDKILPRLDLYFDPDIVSKEQNSKTAEIRKATTDELNFLQSLISFFNVNKDLKKDS